MCDLPISISAFWSTRLQVAYLATGQVIHSKSDQTSVPHFKISDAAGKASSYIKFGTTVGKTMLPRYTYKQIKAIDALPINSDRKSAVTHQTEILGLDGIQHQFESTCLSFQTQSQGPWLGGRENWYT